MSKALDWKWGRDEAIGEASVTVPGLKVKTRILIPDLDQYMVTGGKYRLQASHPFAKKDHKQMYQRTEVKEMESCAELSSVTIPVDLTERRYSGMYLEVFQTGASDIVHNNSDVKGVSQSRIASTVLPLSWIFNDEETSLKRVSKPRIESGVQVEFEVQKLHDVGHTGNPMGDQRVRKHLVDNEYNWEEAEKIWNVRPQEHTNLINSLKTEEQRKLPVLPGDNAQAGFPCSATPLKINCPRQVEAIQRRFVESNPLAYAHQFFLSLKCLHARVESKTFQKQKLLWRDPVKMAKLFTKCQEDVCASQRLYNFDKQISPAIAVKINKDQSVTMKGTTQMSNSGESHNLMGRLKVDDVQCESIRQEFFQKISTKSDLELQSYAQEMCEQMLALEDMQLGDCEDGANEIFRNGHAAKVFLNDLPMLVKMFGTANETGAYGKVDHLRKYLPVLKKGLQRIECVFATGVASSSHPEIGSSVKTESEIPDGCTPLQCYQQSIQRLQTGKDGGHSFGLLTTKAEKITCGTVAAKEICRDLDFLELTALTREEEIETDKQMDETVALGRLKVQTNNDQVKELTIRACDFKNVLLGEEVKMFQKQGLKFIQPCPVMYKYKTGLKSKKMEKNFVTSLFTAGGGVVWGCMTKDWDEFKLKMGKANDVETQKRCFETLLARSARLSALVPNHVNGNWTLYTLGESDMELSLEEESVMEQLNKLYLCRVMDGETKWKKQMSQPELFTNLNEDHLGDWNDKGFNCMVMTSVHMNDRNLEYQRRDEIAQAVKGQWRDLGGRWVLMTPVSY